MFIVIGIFLALLPTMAYEVIGNVGAWPVFQVYQGGTATSSSPSYGQLLVGNSGGTYSFKATSTLGIITALTEGYIYVGSASNEAEATSTIYISSDGRVGVGTTDVSADFNVFGEAPQLK